MQNNKLLQAGKIINTFGVRGEVKIEPWADSPAFFSDIKTFYIDDKPINVLSSRIHKNFLLVIFEGFDDIKSLIKLKGKIICISRDDAILEEGHHYIVDLVGLNAIDNKTGETLGTVIEVMTRPANNVYVIKSENQQQELLIPAVDEFVKEINIDKGYIKFHIIEGM